MAGRWPGPLGRSPTSFAAFTKSSLDAYDGGSPTTTAPWVTAITTDLIKFRFIVRELPEFDRNVDTCLGNGTLGEPRS